MPKIKVFRLFNYFSATNDHELLQWAKAGALILKIKFVLICGFF